MLELGSSFLSSHQSEFLTVTDLSRSLNSFESKKFFESHLLTPKTIAFVDSQISGAMTIMAGLQTDIKILLDPAQYGITRITEEDKPCDSGRL